MSPVPSSRPTTTALLETRGVGKSYATPVLAEVSFDLRTGEVHALVGENGAGKSTFCRILAGLTAPDAGNMQLGGQPYAPRHKLEAEQRGVRMVMQELNLIANLTVAESIFLGHLPHRLGWIDRRRLATHARQMLARVGLGHLNPERKVSSLGVGQQQLVELAAGFSRPSTVLLLDEPTAALTDPEIERLFGLLEERRRAGGATVYVSHRLEEVRRIADRISVLRDGRLVTTQPTSELPVPELVRLMVGRDLGESIHRTRQRPGRELLRVEGLCREPAVREASFTVRAGEILGFAGLMGSGRTEAMRALVGADRRQAGNIYVGGDSRPANLRSPKDAVRRGIALLTENRKEQGLWLPLPLRTNVTLPSLAGLSRAGCWVRPGREREAARTWASRLRVRCQSIEQRALELSGGNQQKVIVARWLLRDCPILIFDEPTRGIDVGAKFEIYRLLDELAAAGKAIVMVSSELKELLALCDRIAVMSAGRLVTTLDATEATQARLMAAALSGYLRRAED